MLGGLEEAEICSVFIDLFLEPSRPSRGGHVERIASVLKLAFPPLLGCFQGCLHFRTAIVFHHIFVA